MFKADVVGMYLSWRIESDFQQREMEQVTQLLLPKKLNLFFFFTFYFIYGIKEILEMPLINEGLIKLLVKVLVIFMNSATAPSDKSNYWMLYEDDLTITF